MTSHAPLQAACASSEDWMQVQKLLVQIDNKDHSRVLENFYSQVDQSDFSLSDWIKALLHFDQWLAEHPLPPAQSQSRPVASMISYIHCCTLTLSAHLPPPELASLTGEMLRTHGFDTTAEVSAE